MIEIAIPLSADVHAPARLLARYGIKAGTKVTTVYSNDVGAGGWAAPYWAAIGAGVALGLCTAGVTTMVPWGVGVVADLVLGVRGKEKDAPPPPMPLFKLVRLTLHNTRQEWAEYILERAQYKVIKLADERNRVWASKYSDPPPAWSDRTRERRPRRRRVRR